MKTNEQLLQYLAEFFQLEIFQTRVERKYQNKHFMFKYPPPENHAMCEIIWKNAVDVLATDDNRIRRMRVACWVF